MLARWALLVVAMAAVFSLARGGVSAQAVAPVPPVPAKEAADTALRIAYPSTETPTLDPHQSRDPLSFRIVGTCYETLYMYAPGGGVVPCLATAFPQVSADGLTVTIKVDTAAKFHANSCFPERKPRNLKASDVVHSFKRLAAGGENGMYWMAEGLIEGLDDYGAGAAMNLDYGTNDTEVAGLKATDDSTVVIKLTRPFAPLVTMLAHPAFSVIAREAMDHYGGMLITREVGTGPYRLHAIAEAQLYVFKHLDDYRGEKPAFQRVTFTQRSYWNEFLDGFKQGTLDEIPMWPAYYDRVAKDGQPAGALKGTPTEIVEEADHGYYFVSFNMDDEVWGAMDADGRALRRAVSLCLDRDTLLSNAGWNSRWNEPQTALLPPGLEFEGVDESLNYGKFDGKLAQQTLDGSKYKGGVDPATGEALTLSFNMPQADFYSEIANALREGLKPLGIKLKVKHSDGDLYRDEIATSEDQLFVSGWFLDYADPFNFLQLFWSANAATTTEFNNTARYRSAEFDKLFAEYEKLAPTDANREKRSGLVKAMAEQIAKDQPTIPISRRRNAKVRTTTVKWPDMPRQSFHDIRFTKPEEEK
jgi:oligopeptide transport system substrate-binding protein